MTKKLCCRHASCQADGLGLFALLSKISTYIQNLIYLIVTGEFDMTNFGLAYIVFVCLAAKAPEWAKIPQITLTFNKEIFNL